MNKKKADYYVYVYWRLDINEPFYVGKGRGYRWNRLKRNNSHFNNIVNSTSVAVIIEKDNLTEKQALYWEKKIIKELVFDYGFSINIPNNRSSDEAYCHLVNCTWGGEGCSGCNPFENKTKEEMLEINKKRSESMKGKKNPMYGGNFSKVHRERMSESHKGEKAYWYGKTLSEEHKRKISENHANFKGESHPFYGKHHDENVKRKMRKNVICLTTKKIFNSIFDASNFYKIKSSTNIVSCCKGKYKSAGKLSDGTKLVWRYLVWEHGKKYKVKDKKIIRIGCDTNDK